MSAVATLPDDVRRVLGDAFGSEFAVDDVTVLRGGRSGAAVYGVRVHEGAFVVRVPDPSRPQHDLRSEREIACMALAAERAIGPRLQHADRSAGITVSARIDGVLDGPARSLAPGRIERLATVLRRLHDGPALPADGNLPALLVHLDETLRARGRALPLGLRGAVEEMLAACTRFGRRTPCHNDLNPGNILETAERAYLIDWEVAGWGDPFIDVALVGVFGLPRSSAREELLAHYLGRQPDDEDRAHALVARAAALGVYAAAFTAAAILEDATPADDMPARVFDEVVADLARGQARSAEVAAALVRQMQAEAGTNDYRAAVAHRLPSPSASTPIRCEGRESS